MPAPFRTALDHISHIVVDVVVFSLTAAVCMAVLMGACAALEAVIIWGMI